MDAFRDLLTAIVAVAMIVLFAIVVVFTPSAPAATIGTLPLGEGSFSLGLTGTYTAPCGYGTLPLRWAAFFLQSNRPNTTFHLSGAWTANRPTDVEFGFSADVASTSAFGNWVAFAHCPLFKPNDTSPAPKPPSLPMSGSVDFNVTTLPDATLFVLIVRAFDPSDVVQVTEPFAVTPV